MPRAAAIIALIALTALATTATAAATPATTVEAAKPAVTLAGSSTLGAILPTPGAALLMTLGGLVMARGGRKAKKA